MKTKKACPTVLFVLERAGRTIIVEKYDCRLKGLTTTDLSGLLQSFCVHLRRSILSPNYASGTTDHALEGQFYVAVNHCRTMDDSEEGREAVKTVSGTGAIVTGVGYRAPDWPKEEEAATVAFIYDVETDTVTVTAPEEKEQLITFPLQKDGVADEAHALCYDICKYANSIAYALGTNEPELSREYVAPWGVIQAILDTTDDPVAQLKAAAGRDVCKNLWLETVEQAELANQGRTLAKVDKGYLPIRLHILEGEEDAVNPTKMPVHYMMTFLIHKTYIKPETGPLIRLSHPFWHIDRLKLYGEGQLMETAAMDVGGTIIKKDAWSLDRGRAEVVRFIHQTNAPNLSLFIQLCHLFLQYAVHLEKEVQPYRFETYAILEWYILKRIQDLPLMPGGEMANLPFPKFFPQLTTRMLVDGCKIFSQKLAKPYFGEGLATELRLSKLGGKKDEAFLVKRCMTPDEAKALGTRWTITPTPAFFAEVDALYQSQKQTEAPFSRIAATYESAFVSQKEYWIVNPMHLHILRGTAEIAWLRKDESIYNTEFHLDESFLDAGEPTRMDAPPSDSEVVAFTSLNAAKAYLSEKRARQFVTKRELSAAIRTVFKETDEAEEQCDIIYDSKNDRLELCNVPNGWTYITAYFSDGKYGLIAGPQFDKDIADGYVALIEAAKRRTSRAALMLLDTVP